MKSREVALTSVFTALVTVTTIMFQVYIPETKGYFNLGEV
ncbi:MAG: ECF transporter S component, partial [Thermoprotei archaeon]